MTVTFLPEVWHQALHEQLAKELRTIFALVGDNRDDPYRVSLRRERYRAKRADAERAKALLFDTLDWFTNPYVREVFRLHKPIWHSYGGPVCDGCDFDGYEAEQPAWPCRTIETLAAVIGVTNLYDRAVAA